LALTACAVEIGAIVKLDAFAQCEHQRRWIGELVLFGQFRLDGQVFVEAK